MRILLIAAGLVGLYLNIGYADGTTYFSDGSTATTFGNTTYFSDGESANTIGDTTYFSDGTSATTFDN